MNEGVSFWKLLNEGINNNDIQLFVVPVIQRDYAQGRTDEKASTIRQKFLNNIGDALCSDDGKKLSLDFIYGAQAGTQIELIDGQQRFTTLFLVHWFLAGQAKAANEDFSVLKKFTYRSRTASRDFCEKLCDNHSNIFSQVEAKCDIVPELLKKWKKEHKKGVFTAVIQDAIWFLSDWEKDPTVSAMLNMLDAIAEQDQFHKTGLKAWQKLTSKDAPIVFHFLSIDKFGNSEDLYIKMNSRGKPLTSFENFKALFGKHLENLGDEQLYNTFWANIDGDWSQHFWEFIKNRYRAKAISVEEYYFHVDEAIMKYIWLQVEMYSVAINYSRKEQPEFYSITNRPLLRFEHIDDPKDHSQDWSSAIFDGNRPEKLIVEALNVSTKILELIEELLDEENGVNCWNATSILDRLFLLEKWDVENKKPVVVKGTGKDDYFSRVLAFVIIYWCSAYGLPNNADAKERLMGYLRVVRNSLQRYRSKKASNRYWDVELDKKNYGKAVWMILSLILNPDKDAVAQMADIPEDQIREISYFAAEAQKCKIIQKYTDAEKENCYKLEDSNVLQGSILPLLGNDAAIITSDECVDLFEKKQHELLAKALLACGDDDCYFGIPSGESENNRSRVAFCDDRLPAWSVSLLYSKDNFSENNVKVLLKLLQKIRSGETLEQIADNYTTQCERMNYYPWQYYFIKYSNRIFDTKGAIKIADRAIPNWPTFDLYYGGTDRFSCRTSNVMSRFGEDNTCNVFLIMAANILGEKKCIASQDFFNGGKEASIRIGNDAITLKYDTDSTRYIISKGTAVCEIEPKEDKDIVIELVSSIENLLSR